MMTAREALLSVVETLNDEEAARVLVYADAISHGRDHVNGTSIDRPNPTEDEEEYEDELTHAVPKLGFAPGSGLWGLMGFIKDDGPTDMAENHDTYLAEAYGDLHEER